MKVVINACFGGFSLSKAAYEEMGWAWTDGGYRDVSRTDPRLVAAVEKLGEAANGSCAYLRVIEIPDDVVWHIHDYDGSESVHENHRTWPAWDE